MKGQAHLDLLIHPGIPMERKARIKKALETLSRK